MQFFRFMRFFDTPRMLAGLLLTGMLPLGAQTPPSGPPSFVPPPPPSFVPPPPPGRAARTERAPWDEDDNRANASDATPQAQSSPQPPRVRRAAHDPGAAIHPQVRTQHPSIVDSNDPRMNDIVGLIQIPDLGTNDVISMLEEFAGKPVLRQQSLPAVKITFFSQGELSRRDAIRALESLLALNGIALTRVGEEFIKAVPAATINAQAPLYWEGSTLGATPTQQIYEKVFELDFLTPTETLGMIQPLMSQGAPIAFEKSGFLLITDALVNLQRIERVLGVVDQPPTTRTEILFYELRNNNAGEVLRRLEQIAAGPLRRRLENNTTFDADERMNQLIVFTHPANKELLDNLIQKMDLDMTPLTTTRVFSIRYAEAVQVVDIIDQVVSGQKQAREEQSGRRNTPAARQQQQQANQAAAALRAEAGNLQFSNFLTLVPDERANSVVASGTPSDIQNLQDLINEIDVLLAQVRIEAVIVEVSLTDEDTTGIGSLGFSYESNDAGETLSINPFSIGGIGFGSGDTPAFFFGPDGEFNMSAFVNAVKQNNRAEVLSAPTIVTTHNREAMIRVGERRPIITGTSITTGFERSNIEYMNIGINLTVTPLIGHDGVIQLEIEQEIESAGANVRIGDNDQPIITSRQASSFVSVGDGQLVVLGGLQSVDHRHDRAKLPILGSLPGLDKLFTRTTVQEDRREIILFLRPQVVRTASEADALTRKQIEAMESRERVESYLDSGTFRRPEVEVPAEEPARRDTRPPARRPRP